jgi:hypothetical protein
MERIECQSDNGGMRHLEIIAQKQNVHRGQSRLYYINKEKERRLED